MFDPSRLMPQDSPGKALVDALNRGQAIRAAASRLTGIEMVGARAARAAFPDSTSIGAAQAIAGQSSLQAAARAVAERNGSAMACALTQSQAVRGASALGLTQGIEAAARTAAVDSKLWDGQSSTGSSTLSTIGTTKAFDPIEAMRTPSKAWESQSEMIEAWGTPQGSRGAMIDLPLAPAPHEKLSEELSGLRHAATEAGEAIAADRRAQVERDKEMVRAMQAMEAALVESAEREADSVRRAEEAEAREIAAQTRSEDLNARLVKLTVQLVALTCLSVIAGLAAVIAVIA
jgi:hypothetical protein